MNNAGITRDRMFLKMTPEDWKAVIDTNLNSMFNVTKQVVPGMVEKGWGRIIQISSVNGEKGQAGLGQSQVPGTSQQYQVALGTLVVELEVPRQFMQSLAAVPGQALHAQPVCAVGAQAARAPPLPQP